MHDLQHDATGEIPQLVGIDVFDRREMSLIDTRLLGELSLVESLPLALGDDGEPHSFHIHHDREYMRMSMAVNH